MKRICAVGLMACCLAAQLDVKVTYRATEASVQDIVQAMAAQAGLEYDWQKSFNQTYPLCRRSVRNVQIEAVPFDRAMRQILEPIGLRYEIENGSVVLFPEPNAIRPDGVEPSAAPPAGGKLINYSAEKKSVQYIVKDLAAQAGLGYNWEKSFLQTEPECQRFLFHVSIKSQPFDRAMAEILRPVRLRYQIEGGEVVLYRR